MANSANGVRVFEALYVSWKLDADDRSADALHCALTRGEDRNLYRLRSWMVARGEARALLTPAASLEEIADALWNPVALPVAMRWIAGQRRPFSSAFRD